MMEHDIVDTAIAAGNFSTLTAALTAGDLVTNLKGSGPFTVFAPTDEAFKKLQPGTVEKLLANKSALRSVLTFHVVSGKVLAADVVKLTDAQTVEGSKVGISVKQGAVVLGSNSTVIKADIKASNGVIHVIDHVLLPPNLKL